MADDVLQQFADSSRDDLGHLLSTAARAVNLDLMARLAEGGYSDVKPAHLPVFTGLTPGGTHISALAVEAGISRQAMSALVKEVEAIGYVAASVDPKDARATLVTLTDRGTQFCLSAIEVSASITAQFSARIGSDRLDDLRDRLRTIAAK
jgi:DNA-binding MarR family transcriptional regulator